MEPRLESVLSRASLVLVALGPQKQRHVRLVGWKPSPPRALEPEGYPQQLLPSSTEEERGLEKDRARWGWEAPALLLLSGSGGGFQTSWEAPGLPVGLGKGHGPGCLLVGCHKRSHQMVSSRGPAV